MFRSEGSRTWISGIAFLIPYSAQAVQDIPIVAPIPQFVGPPSCSVEVCCAPIRSDSSDGSAAGAGQVAWHCFTKCIQRDGGEPIVRACRGGPTSAPFKRFPEWDPLNPNPVTLCPHGIFYGVHGPIDTFCGPWDSNHPDYPDELPAGGDPDAGLKCVQVGDLGDCSECSCIENTMAAIESCCVQYELLPNPLYGHNSNSTARTAIERCAQWGNGPVPFPVGAPWPLGAPGWAVPIECSDCGSMPGCPDAP